MKLEIPKIALVELSEKHEELENFYSRWTNDFELITVNTGMLDDKSIQVSLEQWLNDNKDRDRVVKTCLRKLNSYKQSIAEADTKKIKRLVDVPAIVKGYVQKNLPNQLLYKETDGVLLPYKIVDSKYIPSDQYSPAYADINMRYVSHGDEKSASISMSMSDIPEGGITIAEFINKKGYVIETEELNESMEASMTKYSELINKPGTLWVARNSGNVETDRGWSNFRYHFKPEQDNRVVIDFKGYYITETRDEKFKESVKFVRSNMTDSNEPVKLPIHPYGHVFHLEEHIWIDIHVDNLDEYVYQGDAIKEKLILPTRDKEIISILIEMSKMKIDDIVSGKSGGSFIISTGVPGTGKTLTAEVFSEMVKKPLYKVQCSQLGIDVDSVEKKLKRILQRASRWGAILLIDEADVYVRARGTDINQNAIVGTFLRTLEYYTGILFMTSNMETSIDDAIMSRATAHLTYGAPDTEHQKKIWKVLIDQFGVTEFKDKEINKIVEKFPNLVGRDIKALLKLAMMYSKGKDEKISIDTLDKIHTFVPNVVKSLAKWPEVVIS